MNRINNPLITIGIPTYNRADGFLKDAIRSAMIQTYQNIEIVVSDNCSDDNTEGLIESLDDPRIRYHRHTENIGANNNFNHCLKMARGDYFLLLHDDDMIDSDFIEACMEACHYKTDKGILRTGTRIIDAENKVLDEYPNHVVGLSTEEFFMGWFTCKTSLYLCSTLFNTVKLKQLGGFFSQNNLFQDVFAEVQLAALFGRVDVEDIKASFRKHDEEITFSAKIKDWCEDSRLLIDLMCDLVPENKSIMKKEGMRFLSKINYNMAKEVKSPLKRFLSYMVVFSTYNCRYLPPPVFSMMRYLKMKTKQALTR